MNSLPPRPPTPEPLEDELAASFYPVARTSYRVEEYDYDYLPDIAEEPETSDDELALDTPMKPTPSKKRPSRGSGKTGSKAT